jgi:hypothetical protein
MQIRDLSNKVTSAKLNESLAKKFGCRLTLDRFSEGQLTKAHAQLSEKVNGFEKTNSFDSVHENHEYQKNRAMLDVIRQEIKERTLSPGEEQKREKFVKGMKPKSKEFSKRYGERGSDVMYATATKMAKESTLDGAMGILRTALSERTLVEGEEEKAALIMSSRDMVDKITGWLEDVASMKAETMLDLVDSIRDELGSDISQQFNDTVKPALEDLYNNLETNRMTLAQAVSILTGEEGPHGSATPTMGAPDMGAEMPGTMSEPGEEMGGDEFGGAAAATGGLEAAGRAKRESIDYSRRLGTLLSSKKK